MLNNAQIAAMKQYVSFDRAGVPCYQVRDLINHAEELGDLVIKQAVEIENLKEVNDRLEHQLHPVWVGQNIYGKGGVPLVNKEAADIYNAELKTTARAPTIEMRARAAYEEMARLVQKFSPYDKNAWENQNEDLRNDWVRAITAAMELKTTAPSPAEPVRSDADGCAPSLPETQSGKNG